MPNTTIHNSAPSNTALLTTLHTVNKSPFAGNYLQSCLVIAQPNQALVLLEDGVYSLLPSNPSQAALIAFTETGGQVYALESDVNARGLNEHIGAHIQLISYDEFVGLCCAHNPIQSWY